ncbi:hypothetical protein ACVSUB_05210 [Yersinia enterocolitica]
MTDLFFESLALQRIDLVARLVTNGKCNDVDRTLAIAWISELAKDLVEKLEEYEQNSPQNEGVKSSGRGLQ